VSRLKLHLVDRSDFAKYQDASAGAEGLFVPGSDTPTVGQRVTVEVVFQGGPRILLRGRITWRRATGDARTRPGAGVAVDPTEASKWEYLLGYVRGGLLDVRETRRLPVRLRVTYSGASGRRVNFTRDLNEEGAYVRASEPLEKGDQTELVISPPGSERPISIRAVVARCERTGPAEERGMGVRFDFADEDERSKMAAFVRKLETDYLDGKLADDVLL
jgi:type IV pilus assembly protein PilZ